MRSVLARLIFIGMIGAAFAGCGNGSGSSLPVGGTSNGTGGGPTGGSPGVGLPAACTETTKVLDTGLFVPSNPAASPTPYPGLQYTGFNTTVTSDQSSPLFAIPVPSTIPTGATLLTCPDSTASTSSHLITYSGNNLTQIIFKYSGPLPSLVYQYGLAGNQTFFAYSQIVANFIYAPNVVTPGKLNSIAVELVGNGTNAGPGSLAATYDVRYTCGAIYSPNGPTVPSNLLTTSFTPLLCKSPTPASPNVNDYGLNVNYAGPNAVLPGATGTFTPYNPQMYIVLNFATGTNTSSFGDIFQVADIYALQ